ncbi:MAG: selenocysteine lyase [Bacteroidetes bacterium]|nr:MAG: selenocysteine lyase [Bacteroidota bacterium]
MTKSFTYNQPDTDLETYFSNFRMNITGIHQSFQSPFGRKRIVYADWTAAGRAYGPIEEYIHEEILPYLANTHSETTITGTLMSQAYAEAKSIVEAHVNAGSDDVLIFCGSGMTAAVNKLQRILGLRIPERITDYIDKDRCNKELRLDDQLRPIVFVTHMEHHSNHLSWLETIADVEIIGRNENGNTDLEHFKFLLEQFKRRKNKIAAVTACSNVTGIQTPYHDIAKLIHEYGGLCFVDFACSAPYCCINMHPVDSSFDLDAIYFSFHKFLGGPGTPGVLIFNKKLYRNAAPDQPGGGTVIYSNPWRGREYAENIEQREDGGTPPFIQGMKAAMCVRLKEKMGTANMLAREEEILKIIFPRLSLIKNLQVLESNITQRLGVISFLVEGAHYNLIVQLLNDRFGIQTRGGCSCAGTYGHTLLNIDQTHSIELRKAILSGDLSCKPGWVRLSIHPTMTNAEIGFILDAVEETVAHVREWGKDYAYDPHLNEYAVKGFQSGEQKKVLDWFNAELWSKSSRVFPMMHSH